MKPKHFYLLFVLALILYLVATYLNIKSGSEFYLWLDKFSLALLSFISVSIGYIAKSLSGRNGIIWGGVTLVLLTILQATLLSVMGAQLSTSTGNAATAIISSIATFLFMMLVLFFLPIKKQCSYCRKNIHINAKKCFHCGQDSPFSTVTNEPTTVVETSGSNSDTIKCPSCAEFIKKEAKKCRFCMSDIMEEATKENNEINT
jgi:hypothetical protein